MRKVALGIGIGAVAVIAMHVGLIGVKEFGGVSWPVRPMTNKITDMPLQLENWKAMEVNDLDSRVFVTLDADVAEQRIYEDDRGHKVSYHGSVFEHFVPGVPHSPLVCYPAQGWEKLDTTILETTLPDGTVFRPCLATFEKNSERVLVLFWFQFGDFVMVEDNQMQEAFEYYRPQKEWPSTVKVLMQMSASGSDLQSSEVLVDLATRIYEYTRTLQDGKEQSPGQGRQLRLTRTSRH